MPFINTEGLTIIGDGSQWFWSMLAFLAIPVSGYMIFSQLRAQRSASAVAQVESFDREGTSELMNRHVVDLLMAIREGVEPAELPAAATQMVAQFWETFAGLARAGHRDPKLLWLMDPTSAETVWAWLGPWARWRRAQSGREDIMADLEWLAGVMAKLNVRAGLAPLTPATVARMVDVTIAVRQQLIRDQQAMRTVFVATPAASPVARTGRGRPSVSAQTG